MAVRAIVHLFGEEAVTGDLDEMPNPRDTYVMLRNLRKKDGKELSYIADGATAFLYSWSRITFIELLGELPGAQRSETTKPAGTTVLGFFREEDQ